MIRWLLPMYRINYFLLTVAEIWETVEHTTTYMWCANLFNHFIRLQDLLFLFSSSHTQDIVKVFDTDSTQWGDIKGSTHKIIRALHALEDHVLLQLIFRARS